mgnify:CR=1 FL=1
MRLNGVSGNSRKNFLHQIFRSGRLAVALGEFLLSFLNVFDQGSTFLLSEAMLQNPKQFFLILNGKLVGGF